MKIRITAFLIPAITPLLFACNNSAGSEKPFCDTICLNDTIKFRFEEHSQRPYVYIVPADCGPDSVIWSHRMLTTNRKMEFTYFVDNPVKLNQSSMACYINDTNYAWLEFNDCITARGYLLKLPFNKDNKLGKYSSALTRFDPKFSIADGLIAYADYRSVYVEEIATGKVEKLRFSEEELDIDWNNLRETFDTVNVTRQRLFVNMIIKGKETPLEKKLSF